MPLDTMDDGMGDGMADQTYVTAVTATQGPAPSGASPPLVFSPVVYRDASGLPADWGERNASDGTYGPVFYFALLTRQG